MSAIEGVSEIFDPDQWDAVPGFDDLTDLTYHRARAHGTVRVAFDRPDVLNAFRPHTVDELLSVLEHARQSSDVGCVLLTGNGPSGKNGKWAFCSGGDQRIRGERSDLIPSQHQLVAGCGHVDVVCVGERTDNLALPCFVDAAQPLIDLLEATLLLLRRFRRETPQAALAAKLDLACPRDDLL